MIVIKKITAFLNVIPYSLVYGYEISQGPDLSVFIVEEKTSRSKRND
jgi:hypothetical protein